MSDKYTVQYSIKEGFDLMIVNEYEQPLLFGNCHWQTATELVDLANLGGSLTETLTAIRDLARTGLPTGEMTTEQWNTHRLNTIAGELTRLIESL